VDSCWSSRRGGDFLIFCSQEAPPPQAGFSFAQKSSPVTIVIFSDVPGTFDEMSKMSALAARL